MSDLKNQLEGVVKRVPGLSPEQVAQIVQHLMSPTDVGVTSLRDLADLTMDLMPQNLSLSPLKKIQLLDALRGHCTAQENTRGASPRTSANEPSTSSGRNVLRERDQRQQMNSTQTNTFKFRVKWSDIPQKVYENLKEANRNKEMAHPDDEQRLKLAISKKLVSSYVSFREETPGSQKCPGRKIYENVTEQVFLEFDHCLKVQVNGKVIGDGSHTFKHRLEVCVENLLRRHNQKNKTRSKVFAKKGKGTLGVLVSQYEPVLAPASQTEQEGIREHLQNLHEFDSLDNILDEVTRDLERTYELQRADIVRAKEDVIEASSDHENVDPDDVVVTRDPALKKLVKRWPFLFYPEMMRKHHNRLTGRDIHLEMEKFCENNMDLLILYMTTSSNANIENMAIRLNAETNYEDLNLPGRFMMALLMVANHFKEDKASLIFSAERTLQMDELNLQQTEPCIVAFGQDPIGAKVFAVCADKIPLIKCFNACDAVTCLFEVCFVLDLEYPNLKLTIEFFERFVFGMGFSDTRVEKNGKTVLTLTDGVKRLINGLQSFKEKLEKAQGNS